MAERRLPTQRDRPFTVETAAERLGCSASLVRNMVARGELRHFRIGRLIRISAAALEESAGRIAKPEKVPRRKMSDEQMRAGVVYFIRASGLKLKIGVANDPNARLRDLQIGSAHRLEIIGTLPGGRILEKELHHRFAKYRSHGEWFNIKGDLHRFVRETFIDA